VAKAYFSRLFADNLIKFNYYVEKMPTEGLSVIEEAQRGRVKALTDQPNCDENFFEMLMEEAQADYWKAMNGIILRKHLAENRSQLVPTQLSVSLARPKKAAAPFGLLETGKGVEVTIDEGEKRVSKGRPFVQTFQDYCERTILSEKNVVVALRQVKAEC
jgi:dynein heavy chain, axonemal